MSRRELRSAGDAYAEDVSDADSERISRLSARDLRRELLEHGLDLEGYGEQALALRFRIEQGPRAIVANEDWRPSLRRRLALRTATIAAALIVCVVVVLLVAVRAR
jgi:hypothetical protein